MNDKKSETSSLISNVKHGFFQKANDIKESVTQTKDSGPNYYAFMAFFIVGCLFLLMAFTFLPLVLVSPGNFNLFFSLGSLFMQISLAFFHGPVTYVKMLFSRENMIISILYLASVLLAIYSSLIWGTYLSSLFIVVLQVVTLTYFLI